MSPLDGFGSVLLTLAYDGGPFAGWALQPAARTVAGELWGAIRAIDPRASLPRGTSRTDTGVHALGQVAAFDSEKAIAPRGWLLGLTQHLPREISVVRAESVGTGFDPRRHVRSKSYRYVIFNSLVRDPFLDRYSWRIGDRLNQLEMTAAASQLVGSHDFAGFRSARDQRPDTVRQIFRVELRRARSDDRILEIVVKGDRFLHRMVRIIAGTLVDVGRGRIGANAIARALETRTRADLGMTAPSQGLFLDSVELDAEPRDPWPG